MPAAGASRAFGAADLRAMNEAYMQGHDLDAILNDDAADAPDVVETPVVTGDDQPELAPEAAVPAEPGAPPAPQEQAEPDHVPRKALMEERRKRQELEAQVAQYRQQPQQQPERPDVFADPEGYDASLRSNISQAALNVKLDLSEAMNAERHGEDTVERAKVWAVEQYRINPAFQQDVISQRDPYGYVIKQMARREALEALGDADLSEIQAFRAWKANGGAQPAQKPAPVVPPATLADAQSARTGTVTAAPPSLDDILGRK